MVSQPPHTMECLWDLSRSDNHTTPNKVLFFCPCSDNNGIVMHKVRGISICLLLVWLVVMSAPDTHVQESNATSPMSNEDQFDPHSLQDQSDTASASDHLGENESNDVNMGHDAARIKEAVKDNPMTGQQDAPQNLTVLDFEQFTSEITSLRFVRQDDDSMLWLRVGFSIDITIPRMVKVGISVASISDIDYDDFMADMLPMTIIGYSQGLLYMNSSMSLVETFPLISGSTDATSLYATVWDFNNGDPLVTNSIELPPLIGEGITQNCQISHGSDVLTYESLPRVPQKMAWSSLSPLFTTVFTSVSAVVDDEARWNYTTSSSGFADAYCQVSDGLFQQGETVIFDTAQYLLISRDNQFSSQYNFFFAGDLSMQMIRIGHHTNTVSIDFEVTPDPQPPVISDVSLTVAELGDPSITYLLLSLTISCEEAVSGYLYVRPDVKRTILDEHSSFLGDETEYWNYWYVNPPSYTIDEMYLPRSMLTNTPSGTLQIEFLTSENPKVSTTISIERDSIIPFWTTGWTPTITYNSTLPEESDFNSHTGSLQIHGVPEEAMTWSFVVLEATHFSRNTATLIDAGVITHSAYYVSEQEEDLLRIWIDDADFDEKNVVSAVRIASYDPITQTYVLLFRGFVLFRPADAEAQNSMSKAISAQVQWNHINDESAKLIMIVVHPENEIPWNFTVRVIPWSHTTYTDLTNGAIMSINATRTEFSYDVSLSHLVSKLNSSSEKSLTINILWTDSGKTVLQQLECEIEPYQVGQSWLLDQRLTFKDVDSNGNIDNIELAFEWNSTILQSMTSTIRTVWYVYAASTENFGSAQSSESTVPVSAELTQNITIAVPSGWIGNIPSDGHLVVVIQPRNSDQSLALGREYACSPRSIASMDFEVCVVCSSSLSTMTVDDDGNGLHECLIISVELHLVDLSQEGRDLDLVCNLYAIATMENVNTTAVRQDNDKTVLTASWTFDAEVFRTQLIHGPYAIRLELKADNWDVLYSETLELGTLDFENFEYLGDIDSATISVSYDPMNPTSSDQVIVKGRAQYSKAIESCTLMYWVQNSESVFVDSYYGFHFEFTLPRQRHGVTVSFNVTANCEDGYLLCSQVFTFTVDDYPVPSDNQVMLTFGAMFPFIILVLIPIKRRSRIPQRNKR